MSLDQRLVDSLTSYADGVDMTSTDLDRMQHDLHRRLGQPHRPRRRLVLAAAAVLVLIAAIVGGAWLLRKPGTAVPASPQGATPPSSVWQIKDATGVSAAVVRSDGTETIFNSAKELVRPLLPPIDVRYRVDGQNVVVEGKDRAGQPCRSTFTRQQDMDGRALEGPATLEGPGCNVTSLPPATETQLSPASAAGQSLVSEGSTRPVVDTVQLDGMWLLERSGLLLAVAEETNNGADYLLDDDGDIDRTPDARGRLSATADGQITLSSSGCSDTLLTHATSSGDQTGNSLTATVESDPCNHFNGKTVLTWVKVL